MVLAKMADTLSGLLLSFTPEDGSSIGNQAMLALLRERIPDLQEEDYIAARDELIDAGSLGRGRGRGGSIHRIAKYPENEGDDDAEDDAFGDDFQITSVEPEEILARRS